MGEEIIIRPELSVAEKSRLDELTGVVDRHLKSFMEVGRALSEIRDARLYRNTHESFEEFCKEKWDIGRNYANKQIAAYEVTTNLSSNGYNCTHQLTSPDQMAMEPQPVFRLPMNEAQVRPLVEAKLSGPEQLEIWGRVCEEAGPDGKITAAMVAKAVKGKNQEDVKETLKGARRLSREEQVSKKFHAAFTDLITVIEETMGGNFRDTSKVATLRYLDGLQEVRERIAKM